MSEAQAENVDVSTPAAETAAPETAAAEVTEAPVTETPTPEAAPSTESATKSDDDIKPATEDETKPTTDEETKPATTEEPKPASTEEPESKTEDKGETVPKEESEEAAAAEVVEEPEPIVIPEGNGELVLVTGATSYLASHIVKQLVESEQYRVRGTVSNIEGCEKLDNLKSLLGDNCKYPAEFVEADITKPESWTEAVKDCVYVIHTEPADASEVSESDIESAKEGTLAVLKACLDSGGVKRVVITSSMAATLDKNACTETQWADTEKFTSAYDKCKAIAEKAAWDFMKEQVPEGTGLELSVVNPGFLIGPPLMKMDCASIAVVKKVMNAEYPAILKINFACADVRDAALAHIRAMVIKQAAGNRHIVAKSSVWLKDMANIMAQEFSSQGFNIATSESSYVMALVRSPFNPEIKRLLSSVGKMCNFDNKRMKEVLQVEAREVKDSLVEMGHTMINLEIVKKVEKPEKKSRKLTLRKKKEIEKDLEEGEEKKDEPEKAASTSGSAENECSVPDAAIEEVEVVKVEDTPAEAKEEKVEEGVAAADVKVEVEEEKPAESAEVHSEEEVKDDAAGTSDPESTKKKEKKEKPKKEKKEKKKGSIFSKFSFKKNKKPDVEKKVEEAADEAAPEDQPAEGAAATEEATENVNKEAPAAAEETPATTDEAPKSNEDAAEEAPKAADDTPMSTEEASKSTDDMPVSTEETPKSSDDAPAAADESAAKESAEEPTKQDTAAPTEETTTAETTAEETPSS